MERLLATPKTTPVFPSSNGIIENNCQINRPVGWQNQSRTAIPFGFRLDGVGWGG